MIRKGHDNVNFFTGKEVEKTPAFGKQTLFVVGTPTCQEVQDWIDDFASYEDQSKHIEHIFFGANHSFCPQTPTEWDRWQHMITHFLKQGYLCSLDIPVVSVEDFNDTGLCEFRNFIPQIRVSIPYVQLWNYNTMIKIDDIDFDDTNPGVWTHSLHSLMSRRTFTDWDQYNKDTPV